jgi:hypothetical protein
MKKEMKSALITISLLFFTVTAIAQNVYLYTPNGSAVYAFQRSEFSPAEIAYYTAECAANYPEAEILANASQTYNCHSYAWNRVEGGPICWLNQDPDLHLYWDDGSYEQTTEGYAEKIFYYNGNHSAVKSLTHSGKYESKWGSYPLVRHDPGYGPDDYNMQYRRYYRKCTSTSLTNQTISTDKTITCGDINVQNVTVTNGAKLTLNAADRTVLKNYFKVELGSKLEIK